MCFINIFISNLRQKRQRYSRSQRAAQLMRNPQTHDLIGAVGVQEMRCAVKMNVCKKQKQNKDSMWHVLCRICFLMRHMAAPAGVLISLL